MAASGGVEYDECRVASVSVTVADDETASLAVAGQRVRLSLTEGGSAGTSFTVALAACADGVR